MRQLLLAIFLISFFSPSYAQAASGWINDSFYVPMRAQAGSNYRVVHRGIKSGTKVEVLQWPANADWVQIRAAGVTGWVEAQYMSRTPTAALQLKQAQQKEKAATEKLRTLESKITELTNEREQLQQQLSELETLLTDKSGELDQLQTISAEPIRLANENQKLNTDLSLLRTQLQEVQAENSLLKNDKTFQGWILALGTVFIGMIVGWFFKARSGRRSSNWV